MKEEIRVLKVGTPVKFGEDNMVSGKITAITIRETHIFYEISFWKLDELKTIWLDEKEIVVTKPHRMVIGFIDEKGT
jgi:hypothetical protein